MSAGQLAFELVLNKMEGKGNSEGTRFEPGWLRGRDGEYKTHEEAESIGAALKEG